MAVHGWSLSPYLTVAFYYLIIIRTIKVVKHINITRTINYFGVHVINITCTLINETLIGVQ